MEWVADKHYTAKAVNMHGMPYEVAIPMGAVYTVVDVAPAGLPVDALRKIITGAALETLTGSAPKKRKGKEEPEAHEQMQADLADAPEEPAAYEDS